MAKLYPPVIEGVLPAFYLEYDAATGTVLKGGSLTVPFTMNMTVGESQVKGFSLRLRTASSGSYILPPIYSYTYSLSNGEVTFGFNAKQASFLTEGQYYKIQIAYCGKQVIDEAGNRSGEDIGYYSTVGIAKCVSKPNVSIRGLAYESINAFNNEVFGLYDLSLCKDRTEKVYSYELKVYDEEDNVYFTTGEKLHQSYYDTEYTSSIDRIILNDFASTDTIYSIEYNVTTINGLKLSSPKYRVSSQFLVSPNAAIKILPESDEINGTITVHFEGDIDPARSYYYLLDADTLNELELDEENQPLKDDAGHTLVYCATDYLTNIKDNERLAFLNNNTIYKHYDNNSGFWFYVFKPNHLSGMTAYNGVFYHTDDLEGYDLTDEYLSLLESYTKVIAGKNIMRQMTYEYIENNFINIAQETVIASSEREKKYYGSYLLSRASDADNYTTWFNVARFRLDDQVPSDFSIKDMTIEHGRKYKYALQQYNIWGLYSARIISDIFEANFEDAFLFDGEKSLRIRYNPTVDSFKTTILEQKTDTIGGKYPFITRNGATYYKEFPLGGLLAQEIDELNYFVDDGKVEGHRHSTPDDSSIMPENTYRDYHMFSDSNIALERNFKLKVLEWLNNGKPKLFKSPYEGNYIVRLMNVSLTPVKELGRMLHSFTSTAYEIAECTYENLVAYGFIDVAIPSDLISLWRSYDLSDDSLKDGNGDIIIDLENGIERFTVQDMMPGDMIYLTFSDEPDELPVMIGITGSYTYEGNKKNLVRIRIPTADLDHKVLGIINCFYDGMRITNFDAITSMQLKTIISQQYVGVSPWMMGLKYYDWTVTGDLIQDGLLPERYHELQNYNFRTYLDSTVKSETSTTAGGKKVSIYIPIDNKFAMLSRSFDPGELLDRINLSINKGETFKTELVDMEMIRFRQRPLIPVYTHQRVSSALNQYIPGEFGSLLNEKPIPQNGVIFMVSTSPYGYPHPIEELAEYEMIDPTCIYEVFEYSADLEDWTHVKGVTVPFYDPYYRTWLVDDYDPTVKMNYHWVPVAYLEKDDEGNLTEAAQYLYQQNLIHQDNKIKKERGEYISQAINEEEMYDAELQISVFDLNNNQYYYENNKQIYVIKSNKYDLYEKLGEKYFAIGTNAVAPNKVYWVKQYDVNLNLSTEKVIQYDNIGLMNSYHIGNGVTAELTFQLRIIDYYTETFDNDVREVKEAYLNAKAFYTQLMRLYNNIAKADLSRKTNHAFKELYERMLFGNTISMEQDDIDMVYSVLNAEGQKKELKLMSLYNVTRINTAFPTDALELLVNFKNQHTGLVDEDENEIPLLDEFSHAQVFYYYEQAATRIIDIYYVLDDREIILDLAGGEPDTIYRYKYYGNGLVYFYKVNKKFYIDKYLAENPLAIETDLAVIYNINSHDFEVHSKNSIIATGSELYELQSIDTPMTVTTLALLNEDECAALKTDTYYLDMQLVTDNNNVLYEETEIRDIINKNSFEGASNKLSAISYEITSITNEVTQYQTTLNNAMLDYATIYLNMINNVNTYNEQVYTEWCTLVAIELLNAGKSITDIMNICEQAISDADSSSATLSTAADRLNKMLLAANNLYESMAGDLPTVQVYLKMQSDTIEEDNNILDTYLNSRMAILKGRVVLQFLACRDALAEAYTIISQLKNDTELSVERYTEVKTEFENLVLKFNNIYVELMNGSQLKAEYQDIVSFLNYYYNSCHDLILQERQGYYSDNTYFDLQALAMISNYYNDIQYIIAQKTRSLMNSNSELPLLQPIVWNVNSTIRNYFSQSNAAFFDPITNTNSYNFFKAKINAMSENNKKMLATPSYKNLDTYFYRSIVVSLPVTGTENIITYFPFNPLSTNKKATNITQANNAAYFNTLSVSEQENILKLYKILMSKLYDIISNVSKVNTIQILRSSINIDDLNAERQSILGQYPDGTYGAEKIVQEQIDTAKFYLGENYVLPKLNIAVRDVIFNSSQMMTPAIYKKPNTIDGTNLANIIYLNPTLLEKITKVENSDDNNSSSAMLDNKGIYWEYLQQFYNTRIQELTDLLNYALVLQRLYQKQVDVYSEKYEQYFEDYETNQRVYSSYFGTEAFNYYNTLNNSELTDAEKAAVVRRYKNNVQQAWWAFINLLDARYSAEKERGMYV